VDIWVFTLESQLKQTLTRNDFAKLFGDLLNEWLQSGDSHAVAEEIAEVEPEISSKTAPREGRNFNCPILAKLNPSSEKKVQQDRIQELIFAPKPVDQDAILAYLDGVFSHSDAKAGLTKIRERMEQVGRNIRFNPITEKDMKPLIKSLLSRDLLSPAFGTCSLQDWTHGLGLLMACMCRCSAICLASIGLSWCSLQHRLEPIWITKSSTLCYFSISASSGA
jgi:hypothetical protein